MEIIPGLLLFLLIAYLPGCGIGIAFFLIFRKRLSVAMPFHWFDAAGILIPFPLWILLEHLHWTLHGKSLSNLMELLLIGWFWSSLILLRVCVCHFNANSRIWKWAAISSAVVIAVTILLAVFFPTLPE